MQRSDINNQQDVRDLVDAFYRKVLKDDLIAHFFTTVVQLDWEKHLPRIYAFWNSLLLPDGVYKGNAMGIHFELNEKSPMKAEHFERWLKLWRETVNEMFKGTNAENAISKAEQIAGLMNFKMNKQNTGKHIS
ncbi:MAG: sec-independent protein translocase TatC [Bacteroidetes bacterium]|nr:sec-independent protein translocase TatC [Bacteroidota bacterium]